MKVKFVSLYGQDVVFVPDLGGDTAFEHGEIRELSEAEAKLVLTNPNFVDAETGKNPNFSCKTCGGYRSDSQITPQGLVPYEECLDCRTAAHQGAPSDVSPVGVAAGSPASDIASWRDADAVNALSVAAHDLYQ